MTTLAQESSEGSRDSSLPLRSSWGSVLCVDVYSPDKGVCSVCVVTFVLSGDGWGVGRKGGV